MSDAEQVQEIRPPGLDPRLRVFRRPEVTCCAVRTVRFLVIVDTLVNREAMVAVMETLRQDERARRLPLLVINTHADWDHVWGNGVFAGPHAVFPAPIIGHQLAATRVATPEAAQFLAAYQAEHPGIYDSAEGVPPTVRFSGELTIDGGDLTLQLLPTPGHTPDHVSIWIPEIGTLLAGDAAELPFPLVSNGETLPQLRASLRRLVELPAARVLACHTPDATDPALLGQNIAYFDELERRCRALLASGLLSSGRDDPTALLEWPLEATFPPGFSLPELEQAEFYREEHRRAIRAMLDHLRRGADIPLGDKKQAPTK